MIDAVRRYFIRHMQAGINSLGDLWRAPLASLMTISVIGIAIALPACLYVVLQNAQALTANWDKGNKIALFLAMDTTENDIKTWLTELNNREDVIDVNYISPDQGIVEFEQHTGLSDLMAQLPDNPLPAVVEIYPAPMLSTPTLLQYLVDELNDMPFVETSSADMLWIQRLEQIIYFLQRGVYALMLLLALAVLLIVSNTIRLAMQNRRTEIEIFKLVGATNRFVRRPFLYTGMLYGVFGGIVAVFIVIILTLWLQGPLQRLTDLYYFPFSITGLRFFEVPLLLFVSAALGWVGAYVVVTRHIKHIEPK